MFLTVENKASPLCSIDLVSWCRIVKNALSGMKQHVEGGHMVWALGIYHKIIDVDIGIRYWGSGR
jgi:hypothetical protein